MPKSSTIYIRTSTEEQTPEIQLGDISTLIPLEDAIVFTEQLSAWKESTIRPEFEKLKALIKRRNVETIYVWSLDRLFRNRKRLIEFLSLCKNYDVSVVSYNQKWLAAIQQMQQPWNEIVYDLMLQVVGWIAEDESKLKSNRVKMSVRKSDKGTFSYKGKRWGRKPLPKQTVNRVLEEYNLGKSIREIAKCVSVYDKNNKEKNISIGAVHKIIGQISK